LPDSIGTALNRNLLFALDSPFAPSVVCAPQSVTIRRTLTNNQDYENRRLRFRRFDSPVGS
jgi:hypothetical protein